MVIIASTRPQRVGLPVANWFVDHAKAHGRFEIEVADLKEIGLPAMDEPNHPRLQKYEHEHTKLWSARVRAADAFVFVTPEYNYSLPPALVNALDYLFFEWAYKAGGFVSYGGVSGGTRSVQMSKLLLTSLKIVPLPEAVNIPFASRHLDPSGVFKAEEGIVKAATTMLDELHRWTEALKPLRS
jgi:NAD(P)H-dependent FMN reductase